MDLQEIGWVRTRLIRRRKGKSGWLLWIGWWTFVLHKVRGGSLISWGIVGFSRKTQLHRVRYFTGWCK